MDKQLTHYGILGMKWGKRRYQNKDGSLTPAGKRRLKSDGTFKSNKEYKEEIRDQRSKLANEYSKKHGIDEAYKKANVEYQRAYNKLGYDPDFKTASRIYERAESLSSKAIKDVETDMRKKYGKDYDSFVRSENRSAITKVIGYNLAMVAISAASYQAVVHGSKASVSIGKKIINKITR